MITLIGIAVYLAGWFIGSRVAIGYLMNRQILVLCAHTLVESCRKYHEGRHITTVGATRDRDLTDGLAALGLGLLWPIVLPAHVLVRTTPRTSGESERIMAAQKATIDRLTKEVEADTREARPGGPAGLGHHPYTDLRYPRPYTDLRYPQDPLS